MCRQRVFWVGDAVQTEGTFGGRCSADRGYFWWAMQCRERVFLVGDAVQIEGTLGERCSADQLRAEEEKYVLF